MCTCVYGRYTPDMCTFVTDFWKDTSIMLQFCGVHGHKCLVVTVFHVPGCHSPNVFPMMSIVEDLMHPSSGQKNRSLSPAKG